MYTDIKNKISEIEDTDLYIVSYVHKYCDDDHISVPFEEFCKTVKKLKQKISAPVGPIVMQLKNAIIAKQITLDSDFNDISNVVSKRIFKDVRKHFYNLIYTLYKNIDPKQIEIASLSYLLLYDRNPTIFYFNRFCEDLDRFDDEFPVPLDLIADALRDVLDEIKPNQNLHDAMALKLIGLYPELIEH